jgi:ATP-dependent DNA helicase RecG
VGLLRVGVPDYSERALREALANALIHRDYQRLGAVHFQWHPDRIEVSSPGGFPEGVRLDNLLVTAPRPRNPLLADAFKRAGIVERLIARERLIASSGLGVPGEQSVNNPAPNTG